MGDEQSKHQDGNQNSTDHHYGTTSYDVEMKQNEYARRTFREEEELREKREREELSKREEEQKNTYQEISKEHAWCFQTDHSQIGHGSQQNNGNHGEYEYGSSTQPATHWTYHPGSSPFRNIWESDDQNKEQEHKPHVDDFNISISQYDKLIENEHTAKRSPSFQCSIEEYDRLAKE